VPWCRQQIAVPTLRDVESHFRCPGTSSAAGRDKRMGCQHTIWDSIPDGSIMEAGNGKVIQMLLHLPFETGQRSCEVGLAWLWSTSRALRPLGPGGSVAADYQP